ncbi:hypothetical protein PLICRDRAFT_695347 [Plicaturopsis crispa FD-325 SS-3]|nr:hypothetical protein PLICRDRAFT_695347 [Plicaturopsis crispa FD-325 SS-3]
MAEFIQALDPAKLVLAETILSFATAPFTAPPYNLAIFLFGIYAQENAEGYQSLQTFTGLLGASTIFDIIWMSRNSQNGFIKFVTILILILKLPTFFAFASAMRSRGAQFGGLGDRVSGLAGPTVWSMPGGFTSGGHDGYQNVDEEPPNHAPPRPSGPPVGHAPPPSQPAGPGAYQSV